MGRALAPIMSALGSYHEHIGIVDCFDVIVVPRLLCLPTGKWELEDSIPYSTLQTAIDGFNALKREVRKELKFLPIERLNSCSSHRVENSLLHFRINQHGEFYNPRLHGYPAN